LKEKGPVVAKMRCAKNNFLKYTTGKIILVNDKDTKKVLGFFLYKYMIGLYNPTLSYEQA
jgi:hypothetical protein